MSLINISVKVLEHGEGLPLPALATSQSAGMDLYAATNENIEIKPGERALVPAGFCMALPNNFEAQVRPRSGLALKNGITVLNTPGTIDADYRGEVKVILINLGQETFKVERGMRIAQMIISPVTHAKLVPVAILGETERGEGGFGSTGTTG